MEFSERSPNVRIELMPQDPVFLKQTNRQKTKTKQKKNLQMSNVVTRGLYILLISSIFDNTKEI